MKIGFMKFGNDYNFKPENVKVGQTIHKVKLGNGETIKRAIWNNRNDILNRDKIELRYNVQKGTHSYDAMKSLYKLRSVFGYRLGGAIRQAFVKIYELKRHVVNAVNLKTAIKETRSEKKMADFDGPTSLDKHVRQYSTRDVLIAVRSTNQGKMESLKHLKYHTWDQIKDEHHKMAEENDYSFRKLVVDGVKNAINIRENPDNLLSDFEEIESNIQQQNDEGAKKFPIEKQQKLVQMETDLRLKFKSREQGDLEWAKSELNKGNVSSNRKNWLEQSIVKAETNLLKADTITLDDLAKEFRMEDRLKELQDSKFEPKASLLKRDTFERAVSIQKLDNKVGGLARFISGNSPVALVKRGATYLKCSLGFGGHKYDAQANKKNADELRLRGGVSTAETIQKYGARDPSMRELLEGVSFGRGGDQKAFPDLTPKKNN